MSFEIEYDKNGRPLPNANMQQAAQEEYQEPVQEAAAPESSDEGLAQSMEQLNVEPAAQEEVPPVEQKKDSHHFKSLREKALLLEKERNDALERLRYYESLQNQATPKAVAPETALEDDDIQIGDEDLTEGKHLKKVVKSLNAKLQKQNEMIKAQQQQAVELATEARIKAQFNDFDAVVNQENLKLLSIMHPEVASTIYNSTGDLYAKSVSAYTMIKNLGLYENSAEAAMNRDKVAQNKVKPRPLTSISPQQGDSPLSRANAFAHGLTDDLKKQLHKEMVDSMRNR